MRKTTILALCAAAIAGASLDAAAHGFNAGGGHWNGGGAPGGAAPSNHALLNSNGILALDRDTGLGRAEDRMSIQGLKHEQATVRAGTRRGGRTGISSGSAAEADVR